MHLITTSTHPPTGRTSIGGSPFLPDSIEIPCCVVCNKEMILFFQIELLEKFNLAIAAGSQLAVFMCPTHNWIPEIPTVYEGANPDIYKQQAPGHYKLYLFSPNNNFQSKVPKHPYLEPLSLEFTETKEVVKDWGFGIQSGLEKFKLGGQPTWLNFANNSQCSCGASMEFICQLPVNMGFKQSLEAPEQPHSFSSKEYCLFLGNMVYILACLENCTNTSVLAECDN